jgi:hypothetical protein
VIEILTRGIAIDFDRHASLSRRCKHRVPNSDDTCARSSDPTARVGENSDRRVGDGGQHTVGLILVLS